MSTFILNLASSTIHAHVNNVARSTNSNLPARVFKCTLSISQSSVHPIKKNSTRILYPLGKTSCFQNICTESPSHRQELTRLRKVFCHVPDRHDRSVTSRPSVIYERKIVGRTYDEPTKNVAPDSLCRDVRPPNKRNSFYSVTRWDLGRLSYPWTGTKGDQLIWFTSNFQKRVRIFIVT